MYQTRTKISVNNVLLLRIILTSHLVQINLFECLRKVRKIKIIFHCLSFFVTNYYFYSKRCAYFRMHAYIKTSVFILRSIELICEKLVENRLIIILQKSSKIFYNILNLI